MFTQTTVDHDEKIHHAMYSEKLEFFAVLGCNQTST